MFKATLFTATLLASSASATLTQQQQDAVKVASAAQQQGSKHLKELHIAQVAKSLSAVKDFQLSGGKVGSLQASSVRTRGVSKGIKARAPVRTLRGKGGKGKGKGKDDDETEDEGDAENMAAPMYLQMQTGMCAGTDLGEGPLSEDMYMSSMQDSGACVNSIDSEGDAYSTALTLTPSPFAIHVSVFMLHDCVAENHVFDEDITDIFTSGGTAATDGSCTDMGGYGMRMAISETSLQASASGRSTVLYASSGSANSCAAAATSNGADISLFAVADWQETGLTLSSGWVPLCHSEDDGSSFMYDTSNCGAATPELTYSYYSDNACSVPAATPTETEESRFCFFDYEFFAEEMAMEDSADFVYEVETCFPNM
jgi:hypothetical protein